MPPEGVFHPRPDAPLEYERRLHGPKMRRSRFTRVNRFDRIVLDSKPARLGIMATGKAYLDLRQAMQMLGITDASAGEWIALYKLGLTWPLEESGALPKAYRTFWWSRRSAAFLRTSCVALSITIDASKRTSVVGKSDETGAPLLPSEGDLAPTMVAAAVVARMRNLGHRRGAGAASGKLEAFDRPADGIGAAKLHARPISAQVVPHNSSTNVPEGSVALAVLAATGWRFLWAERLRSAHMGGRASPGPVWPPFTETKHMFQNLGDGTYSHSGMLAIHGAVTSSVNITYKILFNDAVAMTGGQPVEGGGLLTVRHHPPGVGLEVAAPWSCHG